MENFYLCNSAALQADLSKSAFKVYSFLSMGANNKTRSCFHSKGTIAKQCSISASTVVRAIRELCEKGLLEIQRRFRESGKQTSNRYTLIDNPQLKMGATTSNKDEEEVLPLVCAKQDKVPCESFQKRLRLFRCHSSVFHVNLSPNELKIYSYLSFRAGKDAQCLPSKRTIASDCGISISTVSRAIKRLCQADLLEVLPQSRMETCGNNGTSVNLYVLKSAMPSKIDEISRKQGETVSIKTGLLYLLLPFLTPSPMSPVTPHGTISRMKVTLKQRKEDLISKLVKSILEHIYSKPAGERERLANSPHDTG